MTKILTIVLLLVVLIGGKPGYLVLVLPFLFAMWVFKYIDRKAREAK